MKKKDGQGRKPVILLRFSKSCAAEIERSYATHYVAEHRVAELKAERRQTDAEELPSEERL